MRFTGGVVALSLLWAAACGGSGHVRQAQPPPLPAQRGGTPSARAAVVAKAGSSSGPILVWSRSGLPATMIEAIAHLRGARHVVTVVTGTAWLTGSFAASGRVVDRPPRGMAIPLEVAGASPTDFAPFLPQAALRYVPLLAKGQSLLGATSARLRRLGGGGVLMFGQNNVRVAGVVPDAAIGAHEVFVSLATAVRLGVRTPSYLLLEPAPGASVSRLAQSIGGAIPPGLPVRIRLPGQATYLREADAVLPPVIEKALFGEFAARIIPGTGGYLAVEGAWAARRVATASMPILGSVTCNRGIMPLLRGALGEIQAEGLASLIHPSDYGGCYVPRLIPGVPGEPISHHAWGVAIDINVSANPFGGQPHQDPRVVAIFQRWGFTWGGRWLVPDGMHFEFLRFPSA